MGVKSKRKGRAGEQELARLLAEELGVAVSRNLTQCRSGGCDLLGVGGWAIEVKRAATARLTDWWQQTVDQAQQDGCRPALAYRLDRQPWKVRTALADLLPEFKNQPRALEMTAELSLEGFAMVVRETLPPSDRRGIPETSDLEINNEFED